MGRSLFRDEYDLAKSLKVVKYVLSEPAHF